MKIGIGIVCIGDRYLKDFENTFKPSVVSYAQRHGYDLKIFTSHLDPHHTHPDGISFQKCLVPSAMTEYDIVLVMDADIWLSAAAPPISDPNDKIAIVNEAAQFPSEQYDLIGFVSRPTEYYALADFQLDTDKILNTGLFVCRPTLHAQFLRQVYDKYIEHAAGHRRRFHYEQACIGYELQVNDMYTLLPNTWNSIYVMYSALRLPVPDVYGLHFAGLGRETRESELRNYLAAQLPQRRIRWGIRK
jgi:hypothetical protein